MAIGDLAKRAREERGLEPRSADSESEEQVKPDPIDVLVQALGRLQQPASGITKDDLAQVLESNADGMRRALKPENARHPDVSDYNPLGERDHPRSALKRKCFMGGFELLASEMTEPMILLLNSFEHNMEARNGQWRIELRRTSTKGIDELHLMVPMATTDQRSDLPSLYDMLRELHGGSKAVDSETMAVRVAELEKKLEQLQAGAA